jgi:CRISPR-associated protein Csb2
MHWLECLEPPVIMAREGRATSRYTIFVPNNSSLDGVVSTRTSKVVSPRLLADHSAGEPDVVYRWSIPDEEGARRHLSALDEVASWLRALGWGVDFAAATADLVEHDSSMNGMNLFLPQLHGGIRTRVPASGFLNHLKECHLAFTERLSAKGINPATQPTHFGQTNYGRSDEWKPPRSIAFELEEVAGGSFAARWGQVQTVAAWLRHLAAQALLQEDLSSSWVDSFVLGHVTTSDRSYRLSFLPLPSVGHRNSDGGVRRVLIVEPRNTNENDSEALDLLRVKLSGRALIEEVTGAAKAVLVTPADQVKVFGLYLGESKVWETVTPIVLHGHNTSGREISVTKTGRLLTQALVSAGIPVSLIDSLEFQGAPYWPGAESAARIRVPRHLANWPRLHVRARFTKPIRGPVFAGIGRHYGIGVFAGRS